MPENYDTRDYHESLFRKAGDTYVVVGDLPKPPPVSYGLGDGPKKRADFVPLDDGDCLSLETDAYSVDLARYTVRDDGVVEAARWKISGALSLSSAELRLLPGGKHAVVHVSDRDDKLADWGGGPPPDYPQVYLVVDVHSGETLDRYSFVQGIYDDVLSFRTALPLDLTPSSSRPPPWTGMRDVCKNEPLHTIISALPSAQYDNALYIGAKRLLTTMQVIDIATGESLLQLVDESGIAHRMRPVARFHEFSPDENYVLATITGGAFELWNASTKTRWRPELPPHRGVHSAIFLPGTRVALGTSCGGIIVVDCAAGLTPADRPW